MKALILFVLAFPAFAARIEIVGPCSEKPIYQQDIFASGLSVGELTVMALDQSRLQYQGSERGINQIANSPIGMDAMEVISDEEMMAYGWCYSVDGAVTEVYPDEFILNRSHGTVRWFYGYAHYLKGDWVAQCLKSHERRSATICPSEVH